MSVTGVAPFECSRPDWVDSVTPRRSLFSTAVRTVHWRELQTADAIDDIEAAWQPEKHLALSVVL